MVLLFIRSRFLTQLMSQTLNFESAVDMGVHDTIVGRFSFILA